MLAGWLHFLRNSEVKRSEAQETSKEEKKLIPSESFINRLFYHVPFELKC